MSRCRTLIEKWNIYGAPFCLITSVFILPRLCTPCAIAQPTQRRTHLCGQKWISRQDDNNSICSYDLEYWKHFIHIKPFPHFRSSQFHPTSPTYLFPVTVRQFKPAGQTKAVLEWPHSFLPVRWPQTAGTDRNSDKGYQTSDQGQRPPHMNCVFIPKNTQES